jgi:hypothetical protein
MLGFPIQSNLPPLTPRISFPKSKRGQLVLPIWAGSPQKPTHTYLQSAPRYLDLPPFQSSTAPTQSRTNFTNHLQSHPTTEKGKVGILGTH